jgi:hypothetical protein
LALTAAVAASLAGCSSLGPRTVPRDRFDYSAAITDSWKRQTLLNLVKIRYLDPPIFVDVGQIVAAYSLETAGTLGGTVSSGGPVQDFFALGGAARFIDRPTVTYTPLTGNKFTKALLTPLPPESVFSAIQSGWPADAALFLALVSFSGLKNQAITASGVSAADPGFLRALELMRKIQLSGATGMRTRRASQEGPPSVVTFHAGDVSPETRADINELRNLLRISQAADEFDLVLGHIPFSDREIAVQTRTMLQIMQMMSSQVDMPADHLAEGRATPGWSLDGTPQESTRLLRVHSGGSAPGDAHVAVRLRDHWFWIDDRDLKSKRAFALMMLLFSLAETEDRGDLPVLTIPTQ